MADLGYSLGRAAGSDIPLEHFDAKYIKTCRNSTELEEILRILRSGIEGSYPHLEEVVERTLSKLKPDSKVLLKEETAVSSSGVQGSEVNEFLDNLELWRGSLSAEDNQQSLSNGGTTHEASFPPVRAVNVAINRASQPARNNEFLTLGRQFLCVNESELAGKVDKEKQKGNEAFRSGDYLEAVDYYSASLDVKPTLQVYTNRALAYLKIKKFKEALSDCMEALKISPSDTKGNFGTL
jgi:tetratricopeptide (TPR) repeat protein